MSIAALLGDIVSRFYNDTHEPRDAVSISSINYGVAVNTGAQLLAHINFT
jgi:hypothetical protein